MLVRKEVFKMHKNKKACENNNFLKENDEK